MLASVPMNSTRVASEATPVEVTRAPETDAT